MAKVKHIIVRRGNQVSVILQLLIANGFLSGVVGDEKLIYGRYGVNKTTLRKILERAK